ncbi:unnamed protein product [Schistocephalus solidus]|uniref:28S ribosomal protein S14, mitochondrial n=1 Tax=Schistocephalus solidus TaxID=70667 RepID=A0A183T817_SCHSO|nr:unnamed protein product [Schistocephalus solidus]
MALRHLTKLFSSCAIGATSTAKVIAAPIFMLQSMFNLAAMTRSLHMPPRIPQSVFWEHTLRHGFQDAIMVRDYKRRIVAAHFAPLRVRLNAIRKNTILPKDIRDTASVQIHSLPRDSCFTRIMTRCVVTSRRRGCKTRWRVSRIIFRNYADYNRMSGAIWAVWVHHTQCTRRHMVWPPPAGISTTDYIEKYHKNLGD